MTRAQMWYRAVQRGRPTIHAVATVGILTLLVRLTGTAKEVVLAQELGLAERLDAFLLAFATLTFITTLLVDPIASATIPIYLQVRERDSEQARRLMSLIAGRAIAAGVASALILAALSGPLFAIIGSGFEADKQALARNMFVVLLPCIALRAFGASARTVLHTTGRFTLTSIAPIAVPALTAVAILSPLVSWAYVLSAATVAGVTVEAVLLALTLARASLFPTPRLRGGRPELRAVTHQYLPVVASASLMGATQVVDSAMAAGQGAGSVAALGYGMRVTSFVLGIAAAAVGTAVLPQFARLVSQHRWIELELTLRRQVYAIAFLGLPTTLLLVAVAEPMTAALFERGEFGADATRLAADIHVLLVLQIVPYLLGILAVRVLSSLQRNVVLFWMGGVNLAINVIGNLIFLRLLGLPGIALSTSLVHLVSTSVLVVVVRQELSQRASAGSTERPQA